MANSQDSFREDSQQNSLDDRLWSALTQLESQMRDAKLWSSTAPSPQAMASVEPFACDQMSFSSWLQYVFIPRLASLLEQKLPLPENSDMASMAELSFSQKNSGANHAEILKTLREIDQLLTRA